MLKNVIRVGALSSALVCVGCEQAYEEVRITVLDYRFIPARVRVTAGRPVRLLIRNQGRETHRFKSSMLKSPGAAASGRSRPQGEDILNGIPIQPGDTLEIVLTHPHGRYTFQCPIRGHRGMNGIIVVEELEVKPS